jgi:death-on-curing protein
VFGADAYPTLVDKAAALLHSVARNRALVDGNKRLSWVLTRTFLRLNGLDLRIEVDDAERLVVGVAAGRLEAAEVAAVLADHLLVTDE